MEVSVWSLYEILLPRHTEKILTLFYFMHSVSYGGLSFLATYDNGGWWFWRLVFFFPPLIALLMGIVNSLFIPYVNSLTYLYKEKGKSKALEVICNYYSRETAEYLIVRFKENLCKGFISQQRG